MVFSGVEGRNWGISLFIIFFVLFEFLFYVIQHFIIKVIFFFLRQKNAKSNFKFLLGPSSLREHSCKLYTSEGDGGD